MLIAELGKELGQAEFGDSRLSKRLAVIAEATGNQSNASFPSAMKPRAELEACYRFFDNPKVTPERILRPHIEATYSRIAETNFAVIAQDTTEIDLTRPNQQVRGAGPMSSEKRRGAFFHPSIAFDQSGVSLGIVGSHIWTRTKLNTDDRSTKDKKREATPIEEKESYRWLQGFHQAKEVALRCPETTCVSVSDSEADIYELFSLVDQQRAENLHVIVRGCKNRRTAPGGHWVEQARKSEIIATHTVNVRSRKAKTNAETLPRKSSRSARTAQIEVRRATVTIKRPHSASKDCSETVTVNIVLCEERNPPEGETAISWNLVTTMPIETDEDVQRVIETYCLRWQIEVYFRTLKSGCRIEERQFETIGRVKNCLALMSVLAWRLMYVCYLGRECPDIDCEVIFTPGEWKSVYAILDLPEPAEGCPKLRDLVRAIASLGGFIDRPKNEPGAQTLWRGLQRAFDLSTAWDIFGPGAKKNLPELSV